MAPSKRLTRYGLVGAAGLVLAAACATALPPLSPPKTLQPGDIRSLAGQWEGSATGNVGPAPFMGSAFHSVQLTLAEDGSFRSIVDGKLGQGTARIADGRIVFEGSLTRGTATIHERAGRPVMRGDGTLIGIQGWSAFELTRK
jgi:hypothetical protein